MPAQDTTVLMRRKAGFDEFYQQLIPVLVEFVDRLGIQPAHEVLKHAVPFAPYLSKALDGLAIESDQDRIWLLTRVGYFIGEYFAQRHSGCWYVNDIEGSRYFARYVVGRFGALKNSAAMIDPLQIAQVYVDALVPRDLQKLLSEVDAELARV